MTEPVERKGIAAKVRKALEGGLLILFRIKNNRVDYSIMNRPEPTLSEVDDHALATAIVHAGKGFKFKRISTPSRKDRHQVNRDDGRKVTYKEAIDIDWNTGTIESTKGKVLSLQVLSIVVQKLVTSAQKENDDKRNQHGLN